jgi:hypothetical protein
MTILSQYAYLNPFFFLVTSSILSANILQDDQQTKILSLFLYDGMAQVFLEEWL